MFGSIEGDKLNRILKNPFQRSFPPLNKNSSPILETIGKQALSFCLLHSFPEKKKLKKTRRGVEGTKIFYVI